MAFQALNKEQGTLSPSLSLSWRTSKPAQVQRGLLAFRGLRVSPPACALLSFIFKTNALAIVMVRLVDASGNNVTDYRADQPWEVLLTAAAAGGGRTS